MLTNFPLMALALIAYNGIAFGMTLDPAAGNIWDSELFNLTMPTGGVWRFDMGDAILSFSMFLLFIEILKATRIGKLSIIDHLLSTLVLILFLVEFLLVPVAATSTFFLIMLMVAIDVMAGFSVSIRSATRDVQFGRDGGI
ncbi:hypothetical protein [Ahrensia sp. R2A130]|uniref:hypothetical protein n=1 Tax=Ahrensia sp. R2A130 TaxID=744979 RepID=UPI0001E08CA7|nr:hypothetical protein [Ahrensia sp. R2A130]EFL88129.1 conserved hypothetical protein [Ahrensia sp. R2A130]